jgi:hypothetical protein
VNSRAPYPFNFFLVTFCFVPSYVFNNVAMFLITSLKFTYFSPTSTSNPTRLKEFFISFFPILRHRLCHLITLYFPLVVWMLENFINFQYWLS